MGKWWWPLLWAVATRAGCGERGWMSPKGYRSGCSRFSSRISDKVAVNVELYRIWVVLGHKIYAFFFPRIMSSEVRETPLGKTYFVC